MLKYNTLPMIGDAKSSIYLGNARQMLERAIELSGKTQRDVALEVGYSKPNVLSMMKKGVTKIPIDRAPALARACGVDEKMFLRHILNEYMPETWKVISETLETELITDDEREILNKYRKKRDAEIAKEFEKDGDVKAITSR